MASDPDVVGKSITLSGNPYTIVGVVGREFDFRDFGQAPEIFVPFQFDPNTTDQGHYFASAGRLKPGVTLEQAQARLQASAAVYRDRFAAAMPPTDGLGRRITLQEALVGTPPPLGCARRRGIRAAHRVRERREPAADSSRKAAARDRHSLGARRRPAANRAAGPGRVAAACRRRRRSRHRRRARRDARAARDQYGWPAAACRRRGVARHGLAGRHLRRGCRSRPDCSSDSCRRSPHSRRSERRHQGTGSRSGSGRGEAKLRSAFVLVEVVLAVVLLIGAALLIRTSIALSMVEPGSARRTCRLAHVAVGPALREHGQRRAGRAAVRERLLAMPGVVEVGAACCIPTRFGSNLPFNIVGREPARGVQRRRRFDLSDAGLFRHISYSSAARPRFQRPRLRRRRPWSSSTKRSGPFLAQRRCPRRADLDRQRQATGSSRWSPSGDRRHRGRRAERGSTTIRPRRCTSRRRRCPTCSPCFCRSIRA